MAESCIVVAEDERNMRRFVLDTLVSAGFVAYGAEDGASCLELVRQHRPDLVILDVLMPGLNGLAVLNQLRAQDPELGIMMLTGLDAEDDKIAALEGGADDYLTKPFAARELVARTRALLRRTHHPVATAVRPTTYPILDATRRSIRLPDREVQLTAVEFRLMETLMVSRGRVHTPVELARVVWGSDYGDVAELVRTNVYRLRRKLEEDPSQPKLLMSHPGVGYFLAPPEAASQ